MPERPHAALHREVRALQKKHVDERRPLRKEAASLRQAIRRCVRKSTRSREELRALGLTAGERAEVEACLANVKGCPEPLCRGVSGQPPSSVVGEASIGLFVSHSLTPPLAQA